MTEMEERLRAALSARAELVLPEGLGSRPRSDDVAPKPDAPQLELPADVGRDWEPNTLSRPPRLDLDGDGAKETVEFLAEPTKDFDGRFRMQTTLSSSCSGTKTSAPAREGAATHWAAEASDPPPAVAPVATTTFGVGEGVDFSQGYRFSASIEAFADPSLVVEGCDGRTLNHGLEVVAPRVSTVQPTGIFSDGASFVVTSGSDPSRLEVLVQNGDELRALDPVGEVPLENAGAVRTWLTQNGALVSVVAGPPDRHRLLRRHR